MVLIDSLSHGILYEGHIRISYVYNMYFWGKKYCYRVCLFHIYKVFVGRTVAVMSKHVIYIDQPIINSDNPRSTEDEAMSICAEWRANGYQNACYRSTVASGTYSFFKLIFGTHS